MNIFNRTSIYYTIFFNIQSVTEYGSIEEFEKKEPEKYNTWVQMAKKRYDNEFPEDANLYKSTLNRLYLEKACFLPEFSKIITINYATVKSEDGKLKRIIKKINDENEIDLIKNFINVLNAAFSEGHNSTPKFIPNLCGHNIIGHDIPLFIKRILKYRDQLKLENEVHIIPPILKHHINCKPWESNVIDTVNMWKFNGTDFISLNLISDFINLKKTVKLLSIDEINKLYWLNKENAIEEINLQSANFVNLAFQLVNELRQM